MGEGGVLEMLGGLRNEEEETSENVETRGEGGAPGARNNSNTVSKVLSSESENLH